MRLLPPIKVLTIGLLLSAVVRDASAAFKVVGYEPSWQGSVSSIQYSKVTHINYAFLLPNSDGSLQPIDNASKLSSLVTSAHNNVNFINQYNLDGVDIDWEYPDTSSEGSNYTTLMSALSSAMHSRGKLLTAAVIAYGSTGDSISSTVFGYIDWFNVMDYDNTSGVGQSTYNSAITALDYWNITRGLPASKAQLGVPFYS